MHRLDGSSFGRQDAFFQSLGGVSVGLCRDMKRFLYLEDIFLNGIIFVKGNFQQEAQLLGNIRIAYELPFMIAEKIDEKPFESNARPNYLDDLEQDRDRHDRDKHDPGNGQQIGLKQRSLFAVIDIFLDLGRDLDAKTQEEKKESEVDLDLSHHMRPDVPEGEHFLHPEVLMKYTTYPFELQTIRQKEETDDPKGQADHI
ncbi:MAG: hypothetical protein ABIK28_18555 [Planctomycetota bacterium]